MPIQDRNNLIKQVLKNEKTPVLPFELEIIDSGLRSSMDEQRRLGEIMGEAMTQSSETWHDNAPAEAIANESRIVSDRARRITHLMGTRALFDYTTTNPEEDNITLGSIVEVIFAGEDEAELIVITGASRQLTPEVEQFVADGSGNSEAEAITVSSPLGTAILGRTSGDVVEYEGPNGHTISLTIVSIRQLNI